MVQAEGAGVPSVDMNLFSSHGRGLPGDRHFQGNEGKGLFAIKRGLVPDIGIL